jgi:hypothetical protein
MMAYGKGVRYEHICAFLTLALGENEQSVSCFSTVLLGATSLMCTGYAPWIMEPDLANTGKEKTLATAWHPVHSLVILLTQFTKVKKLKRNLFNNMTDRSLTKLTLCYTFTEIIVTNTLFNFMHIKT